MSRRLVAVMLALLGACSDGRQYARDLCVAVDTSGTYTDRLDEMANTMKRAVLPKLGPGDRLIFVRIDSDSYDEGNVERIVQFDARPSQSMAQKAELARFLDHFEARTPRAEYTDIRGAMMLCGDYLRDSPAGERSILVFTDLVEDLRRGAKRTFAADELRGIRVAAMHVKRLGEDRRDPTTYRARLASWEKLVRERGAAEWRTLREPEELVAYLEPL